MVDMSVREKVGRIFVSLTQKLYGGEITNNGDNDSDIGNIDIINWERNQGYESKGSISSDHHKIQPLQIDHNRNFIEMVDFPLDHPEIYYMLWQYNYRGVSKLDEKEIEKEVVGNVKRLLVVSFDIIEAGSKVWETTGERSWGEVYMLRSSERTAMTKEPKKELERMGLRAKYYEVSRETIDGGEYRHHPILTNKYRWMNVPSFEITSVINKKWEGLERLTREKMEKELREVPF